MADAGEVVSQTTRRAAICCAPTFDSTCRRVDSPLSLSGFDYAPRPRIVFGPGSLERLGALVREYGGRRVLLVTDPGIIRAGHARRAEQSLATAGLKCVRFDGVIENPTTEVVEACRDVAKESAIDFIVGLGGGSSLDTAKGCNFLLTNGGRMEDYWGVGKATQPMLPLIAVPTTTGTGSECQSFALIAQRETHVKMACGDRKAAAKVALLDPELTVTMPAAVAAVTGMDALSHAVESAVCRKRNAISHMFSLEAFRLCVRGQKALAADGNDLAARGDTLLGAALGGKAIENSMLGAAHAAANPLTARFGVVHGQAVGLMLPAVIRYNACLPAARETYQELAVQAGLSEHARDPEASTETLIEFLEEHRTRVGLVGSLTALGLRSVDIEMLSDEAARQWTAGFNPRPIAAADFVGLYQSVMHNRRAAKRA